MSSEPTDRTSRTFALYFIPPKESLLYAAGAEILGYDIYSRNCQARSPFGRYAEATAPFGFHLTIADALYFRNDATRTMAIKDISSEVRSFDPFSLKFRVQSGFPTPDSISLICQDPTGALEALHHETVFRCYRRAMASNYSPDIGLAKPNRDQDIARANLMIKRYHAPYILGRFRPHFSLLSKVPFGKLDKVRARVEEVLFARVTDSCIHVNCLAVMQKKSVDSYWQIERQIQIGPASRKRLL